jgi:hypothetical protein
MRYRISAGVALAVNELWEHNRSTVAFKASLHFWFLLEPVSLIAFLLLSPASPAP